MMNSILPKFIYSSLILIIIVSCHSSNPAQKSENQSPNVILMIGDGMGLPQVTTSFYFKDSPSNFEHFKSIGLIKTSSVSHKITDSAAGATAFSTGEKTYKRAIGVSRDTIPLTTIVEQLELQGFNTGLISLTSITHATPASFYAHVKDRDMHEDIASFLPQSGIDFFAGGGLKYFNNRKDGNDIYSNLELSGYIMDTLQLPTSLKPGDKYGFLLAEDGLPSKIEGRGNYLSEASRLAMDFLSSSGKPFFLMIEGSYIDWGGHKKDADLMVQEVLDFDRVIGQVLDFMERHENTILIVTADHETGGAAVGKYYKKNPLTGEPTEVPDSVAVYFNTDQHTTELIPVFAKGKGEELFSGIYENNEINKKIMQLIQ